MKATASLVWRNWGRWVAVASVLAVAPTRHCPAIGCGDAGLADELGMLIQVTFDDSATLACTTPDQNLDARVSAADLTRMILTSFDPPKGPTVTFLGLATADGRLIQPAGYANGLPVYQRNSASGFLLVVEGRAGLSARAVGPATFQPGSSGDGRPDLQLLFSRPLGDGSGHVCFGGVPAVVPPDYRPERFVTDALNDIGCNFALSSLSSCVVNSFGQPIMAGPGSQIQFCATVSRSLAFAPGDTTVTVRLRDVSGYLGLPRQMVVRVGETRPSPTPSLLAVTPTASPSASATVAATFTASSTRPPTVGRSPSSTPSAPTPATPSATATRTRSTTPTATPTPGRSASPSPTRVGVSSHTPTHTLAPSRSPTALNPSATPTRSLTATATRTPTAAAPTATASRTRTATASATPTVAASAGPVVTFFGVTRADDTLVPPSGSAADGTPIFERPTGAGFNLVIEGRPGATNVAVGTVTFRENGPPDLQILVSRALGDGSTRVCDRLPPGAGGVPAIDPPQFRDTPEVIDALNDFGCRFLDGSGQPRGRGKNDACVLKADGGFDFVNATSTVQFCGFIDVATRFPSGDVRVTVRLRDERGQTGPAAQIILRIQS